MKKTIQYIFLLCSLKLASQSTCFNAGFEQTAPGTYTSANAVSGWSISSATYSSCTSNYSWVPGSSEFSIITTPLIYSVIGIIPHSPLSGTNIAVLNNSTANSHITRLQRTIQVGSNPVFVQFSMAGLWQNSSHTCCAQAGFSVRFLDSLENPLPCTTYSFSGSSCQNSGTFSVTAGMTWSNWLVKAFDLSQYLNSTLTMEVLSRDCGSGDHFGTMYFDFDCQTYQIQPSPWPWIYNCAGSNTAILNGPAGFASYLWFGPSGYPISPAQSTLAVATITNALAGNVYTLIATTALGCPYTYTSELTSTSVAIAGIGSSPSCSMGTSGSATVAAFGSGSGYNYTWVNNSNIVVGTQSVLSNVAAGIYTVQVMAAGSMSAFCGLATNSVMVGSIGGNFSSVFKPYCTNQQAYLDAGAGTNYQWYNGTVAIAGNQGGNNNNYVVPAPVHGDTYHVSYLSSQGCSDSVRFILVQSPANGSINLLANDPVCAGAGSATALFSFTPSSGVPPSLYHYTVMSAGSSPSTLVTFSASSVFTVNNLIGGNTYSIVAFDNFCRYTSTFTANFREFPQFSLTSTTQSLCEGSSAIAGVSFSSGSPLAKQYTWAPTALITGGSNLQHAIVTPATPPGTSSTVVYSVTVTPNDLSCPVTKTLAITVTNPGNPTIVSKLSPFCANSPTIPLQASPPGGTFVNAPGSNAVSSDGILTPSLVSPGAHSFSYAISLNNCQSATSASYTVLAVPQISVSGNSNICAGETATLTATGANNLLWVNMGNSVQVVVSPSTGTTYTVSGTAGNGCAATKLFSVQVTPYPQLSLSGNLAICIGDTAVLSASGADTYSWSTGGNASQEFLAPLNTGTFLLTGTNNPGNCSDSSVFNIKVNPLPILSVLGPTVVCKERWALLVAQGAASYEWDGAPGSYSLLTMPDADHTFYITGTDTNGCVQEITHTVKVKYCTGLDDEGSLLGCRIYPNPAQEVLYLELEQEKRVMLYDPTGRIFYAELLSPGAHRIDISSLSDGLFLVLIESLAGKQTTVRLVKSG